MPRGSLLLVLGLCACDVARLQAQSAVYVEYKGKGHLVRAAQGNQPVIEVQGRLQQVMTDRIVVTEAKDYLPALVSVTQMNAASSHQDVAVSVQSLVPTHDHELWFSAEVESPYLLENVFLLLEFRGRGGSPEYFLREIGQLIAHRSEKIGLLAPLSQPLEAGSWQIHLFSNGAELLNSSMPVEAREQALDRMVARRVGKLQNAEPQPLLGPPPHYPDRLRKSKVRGSATISMRITPTGVIADPQVLTATSPEFGEAALAAARLWRFIPAVRNGQAVEMKAEMPFAFKAPDNEAKQVN